MAMLPRIGLTKVLIRTCAAPKTRQAAASARKRGVGDHHQHEGADQPGHAHVGIDAGERRQQDARQRREAGADHEHHEAHAPGVDAEAARQGLVHDHRPGREAEPGPLDGQREQRSPIASAMPRATSR